MEAEGELQANAGTESKEGGIRGIYPRGRNLRNNKKGRVTGK